MMIGGAALALGRFLVIRRVAIALVLLACTVPSRAANKDMDRLNIQMSNLTGQLAELQRTSEETLRELRRLNELLADQSASLKKSLQDQKVQDESLQTTLKELKERLGDIETRLQGFPAGPPAVTAPAPSAGGEPSPTPPAAAAPAANAPPPRELYSQAYADYARGNYDLAIQEFQEYLKSYPNTDLSDNAQYWIGESLYGKQRFADAVEAWNALLRDFPASDKLPDARVKKGMALEKLGRRSQALLEYRYVVDRYPNSPAARVARDKLNPQ